MEPGPDVRADRDLGQAELLVELAPESDLVVLIGLLAAARRRPDGDPRKLEADEEDPIVGVEQQRPHRGADPEAVRNDGAHVSGDSGRPSLNA